MEQSFDNMSGYEATVPVMIANIQRLRAVNAKLLAALELLYLLVAHPVKGGRGLTRTSSEIIQQAHDAIEQAKK